MGRYELWLTDDFGVRLASLDNIVSATFAREANRIAYCSISLPRSFDTRLVQVPDRMVQVWRAPEGGRLGLWRTYFVRKRNPRTQGSWERFTIGGPCSNDLGRRRIVAAFAESAQAGKVDFADDMAKEIMTEALADGVAPTPDEGTRAWDNLSVQADVSAGPSITKAFAFAKLLSPNGAGILANIAKNARQEGTEIFFDFAVDTISTSNITFQFRTTTGQPGTDRTTTGVLFDQEKGNLANPDLDEDYSEEINYVYAAGQGDTVNRDIEQAADSTRYNQSQWGRNEGFTDGRRIEKGNAPALQAKADEGLEDGRPRRRFTAQPLDIRGSRFGIDWDYGDKARARYQDEEFDTIIRAVVISLSERGKETITARLDYEGV